MENRPSELTWYELIRREREQRSWTQAEVAEKIGVGVKTVGRWERGESFPLPLHRRGVATIYEKSLHELKLNAASTDKSHEDPPQQVDEEVIEIGNAVEKGHQWPEVTIMPSDTGSLLRFIVQINLRVPKTI